MRYIAEPSGAEIFLMGKFKMQIIFTVKIYGIQEWHLNKDVQ